MVGITPFAVEQWMNAHEETAKYNIAETCCASISIDDLLRITKSQTSPPLFSTKLTYGSVRGSTQLRSNLSKLYNPTPDISAFLITQGAIAANFLVFYALVKPGDHVICVYPTYQQLYSVPASFGAEVSKWTLKETENWIPSIADLESLLRPNTKMIVLNNPNNPTGAPVSREILEKVVEIARKRDITILSDEVYRPLFHGLPDEEHPPSMLDLGYDKVVVTGSMSKAWALAGIRTGWIACRDQEIIEACASARDYNTITAGQLGDQVATCALAPENIGGLLERNMALARSNLDILAEWVEAQGEACQWVKPKAGTTAFIRFLKNGSPVDDEAFCQELQDTTGVMIVPGKTCFGDGQDFAGFVRVGYVCEEDVLRDGLAKLSEFLGRKSGS